MKRIIFCLLAIAGISTVNAQTKGNFEFGLGTGLNISTLNVSDHYYGSPDANVSYNFNASAEYYFSSSWGIKAMVMYDRKGWDNDIITDIDTGRDFRTDINLDYITIPVMGSWHFGPKKNLYLSAGPYIGFLLSAKDTAFKADLKDSHVKTDGGIAWGGGIKIPVSDYIKIFIEYQQQAGVVDIFKGNYSNNDIALNNRSAFNIGINFML